MNIRNEQTKYDKRTNYTLKKMNGSDAARTGTAPADTKCQKSIEVVR
jgi:hypothetical protein